MFEIYHPELRHNMLNVGNELNDYVGYIAISVMVLI